MKKYITTLAAALACLIFASCAQTQYSDSLSCEDISTVLESEILGEGEYLPFEDKDIKYMFDTEDFESCRVIYSKSSDDIGEVGIFHAESAEKADKLLEEITSYIEDFKEEKSDFLRNYLPEEFDKLDNARVKRFGNYVVYTILPADIANRILEHTKVILSK